MMAKFFWLNKETEATFLSTGTFSVNKQKHREYNKITEALALLHQALIGGKQFRNKESVVSCKLFFFFKPRSLSFLCISIFVQI